MCQSSRRNNLGVISPFLVLTRYCNSQDRTLSVPTKASDYVPGQVNVKMNQVKGVAAVRSLRARLAQSVFIVVLAAAAVFAQQKVDPAAVTGTVSDQKGVGVGGATVSMQGGPGPAHTVTTDDQGLYAIT